MPNSNGTMPLPPGATLVDPGSMKLPPGATLVNPPASAAQRTQAQPEETETTYVPMIGGGGFPMLVPMQVPKGQVQEFQQKFRQGQLGGVTAGLAGVGAALAPELMPEAGPGILGYITSVLGRTGLAGAGAVAGTSAGQAISGQNPLAPENLRQSIGSGALTGALSVPFEMAGQLPFTKAGRAAVNLSLGAQARDVTYGNPALGIANEGIKNPFTGDFEAYKDALRQGCRPECSYAGRRRTYGSRQSADQ